MLGRGDVRRLRGVGQQAGHAVERLADTGQARFQVQQGGVDLRCDLQAEVVAEIVRRASDEVALGGRRVGVPVPFRDEESDTGEGRAGEQCLRGT